MKSVLFLTGLTALAMIVTPAQAENSPTPLPDNGSVAISKEFHFNYDVVGHNFPLGLTESGASYAMSFQYDRAAEDSQSPWALIWHDANSPTFFEIHSIDSVNRVIESNFGVKSRNQFWTRADKNISFARLERYYFEAQVRMMEHCIGERTSNKGATSLCLDFDEDESGARFRSTIARMSKKGLPPKEAELLLKLGGPLFVAYDRKSGEWSASWCQIIRTGAIERVTLKGTLPLEAQPGLGAIKLRSILKEEIAEPGTISPSLMRSSIIFTGPDGMPFG